VDEKIYNSALIVNRKGEFIYQYDKIHLVPMLDEPLFLEGGQEQAQLFELDGVKCGVIICYDLRFPELIRSLALKGAKVLFIPSEWPIVRREHWRYLQIARAIENQMYVVSCNRVGAYNNVEFAGTSMVTDPTGNVVVEGSIHQEQTLTTTINMEHVNHARELVPIFSSRVPRLY
jgi:omega-amidase